jgi:hypothetical protein
MKAEQRNLFYQDSIKNAINVIIEKLDERILESETNSMDQSKRQSVINDYSGL